MLELLEITSGHWNDGKLVNTYKTNININNIEQVFTYKYMDSYGGMINQYMIETHDNKFPITKETYYNIINTYSIKRNVQN